MLKALLTAPLLPLKAVVSLGQFIQDQAEQAAADPVRMRRAMDEIDGAYDRGEITEAEGKQAQKAVLEQYMTAQRRLQERSG